MVAKTEMELQRIFYRAAGVTADLDRLSDSARRDEAWNRANERQPVKRWEFVLGSTLIPCGIVALRLLKPTGLRIREMLGVPSELTLPLGVTICWGMIVALYFAPIRLLRASIRRAVREQLRADGLPTCIQCGYDSTGTLSGTCPECGAPAPGESQQGTNSE